MRVDRAWLKAHAAVTLAPEWDNEEPVGFDAETMTWIREEFQRGNVWSWCHVTVTAYWNGYEAEAHLSGCSYQNEAAFKEDGFFDDMVDECIDEIATGFERLLHAHGLWKHDETLCLLCTAGSR